MSKEGLGRVLWFNEYKGYGEIRSEDGRAVFFLQSALKGKNSLLREGDVVRFILGEHRLFGTVAACDVLKVKNTKLKRDLPNTLERPATP